MLRLNSELQNSNIQNIQDKKVTVAVGSRSYDSYI